MGAEPADGAEQVPSGTKPRQGRWDPAYAAVAITLIGGVVYAFFRLAYASFYAALHTTPEEVGLNYSQTIVRGVIPSLSITALALIIAALLLVSFATTVGYFVMIFNLGRMFVEYRRSRMELKVQAQRDSQASPSPSQLRENARRIFSRNQERHPRTMRIFAAMYGMSDAELIATVEAADAQELEGRNPFRPKPFKLIIQMLVETWRFVWGVLLHRVALVILLILTLVGLTVLIRHQTQSTANGNTLGPALSILTGLRAEKVTIGAVETGKNLPAELSGRTVIYLGEANGLVVLLISHGGGRSTTMRVPSSAVVIRFDYQTNH